MFTCNVCPSTYTDKFTLQNHVTRHKEENLECNYCDKSFYCTSGGFIRGLNCSSGYGEYGAEADGTLASETPVTVAARGEMLKYATAGFIGAATESDVADTVTTSGTPTAAAIVGVTSGATATISRVNISLDHLHIESRSGNFTQGEVCTVTKDDSSTYQLTLDASFGDSSAAQTGQEGPLIRVDGSALSSASASENFSSFSLAPWNGPVLSNWS